MSKEKAKEFVEHLKKNPELVEKMKGFTQEDLKDAIDEMKTDGSVSDSEEILPHLVV
jgi:hypothetical protein